jgi:hypothetical protein
MMFPIGNVGLHPAGPAGCLDRLYTSCRLADVRKTSNFESPDRRKQRFAHSDRQAPFPSGNAEFPSEDHQIRHDYCKKRVNHFR